MNSVEKLIYELKKLDECQSITVSDIRKLCFTENRKEFIDIDVNNILSILLDYDIVKVDYIRDCIKSGIQMVDDELRYNCDDMQKCNQLETTKIDYLKQLSALKDDDKLYFAGYDTFDYCPTSVQNVLDGLIGKPYYQGL